MIGERIQHYRKLKKMKAAELAERIEISYNYLSEIERGVRFPSLDTFTKLCEALEVPADYLLRDKHIFAVFSLNHATEQLKHETTKKLNCMIDLCDILRDYAQEES